MAPTKAELARRLIEEVRLTLMDEGYHFPNEELEKLDDAVVLLGGKSMQDDK